ncbi:MAG TPA: transketolase family protein [Firmicutes bacterium]|jgi:transketolase|nr:transketolase family protein [Bacillota bacterium]
MSGMKATRDAYGETLVELGRQNPDIVALDADLSSSTRSSVFAKEFPERFFNVGIAEANMMGIAAGLAHSGKIPFASTFAVFATGRAYDQIRQSIAHPGFNVKIAASHAGITVGEDGATHQALEDIALMRALPGMTVLVPCDARQARLAVLAAAAHDGPVYIRLGRAKVPQVFPEDAEFTIGKGLVLWPEPEVPGRYDAVLEGERRFDVAFVACGITVGLALEAARALESEGISCVVADMASVKPVDEDLLVKIAGCSKAIITCEEHSVIGGLGSAVCEVIARNHPVRVVTLGINDEFGESGPAEALMERYGFTSERYCQVAREILRV